MGQCLPNLTKQDRSKIWQQYYQKILNEYLTDCELFVKAIPSGLPILRPIYQPPCAA